MNIEPMRIVCFKWIGNIGRAYGAEHVNRLYKALRDNLSGAFTLYCVTDDPSGLGEEIEVYDMPESCRTLVQTASGRFAKLFMFSDEFSAFIKEKFVYLDLDVTIAGDFSRLVDDSTADLTMIAGGGGKSIKKKIVYFLRHARLPKSAPVNSSVMVVQPFKNADLWEGFDSEQVIKLIKKKRYVGTDQAWIYIAASDRLAYIGRSEGVYKASMLLGKASIPEDVKIVFFPGYWHQKPWMENTVKDHPWMRGFQ